MRLYKSFTKGQVRQESASIWQKPWPIATEFGVKADSG